MRFSLDPYTREQTRGVLHKFFSWTQADLPSQFAVIFRGNNELIGYCGFSSPGRRWNEIEIGHRLHPDYWNRGLASERLRLYAIRRSATYDYRR